MQELDIQPVGSITSGSGTVSRSISEKALAQQFCTVANDIRATLSVLRESAETQKAMLEGIHNTIERINAMHECIDNANANNSCYVDKLNKNTEMLVKAFTSHETFELLNSQINSANTSA